MAGVMEADRPILALATRSKIARTARSSSDAGQVAELTGQSSGVVGSVFKEIKDTVPDVVRATFIRSGAALREFLGVQLDPSGVKMEPKRSVGFGATPPTPVQLASLVSPSEPSRKSPPASTKTSHTP